MALIQVSIAENISVESVNVNEQGSLEVTFVQSSGDNKMDLFEAMTSGASMASENKSTVKKFPVGHKRFGKEASAEELVKLTIVEEKALLEGMLEQFNPTKKMDYSKMFEGTGITSAADINTKLASEEVMKQVSTNLYKAFAEAMKDADKSIKVRFKFPRQSEAKHYITFPKAVGFKKGSFEAFKTPFIESMVIPTEQSKLKFSDYEISKGLNHGNPVTSDAPSGTNDLPFEL